MAQITIELPDELAQQLIPFQSQFPDLFTRLIATPLLGQPTSQNQLYPGMVTPSGTYQEILDFLMSRPTSEEIVKFKVSEGSQTCLQTLLQKQREMTLTSEETSELDLYEQLDTLIGLLKVRAYASLNLAPQS